jgi:hypothetical protein
MALSTSVMAEVDSVLESISIKNLEPPGMLLESGPTRPFRLNWAYGGAAIHSLTHILNDEGDLWLAASVFLRLTSTKLQKWPLELAFHTHNGHLT